ncbi:MAG: hypothetical protein ACRDV8_10730, partial [Acidimicrobiales bacterium]
MRGPLGVALSAAVVVVVVREALRRTRTEPESGRDAAPVAGAVAPAVPAVPAVPVVPEAPAAP